MAVSWTQFTPANLRTCWTSGSDLKASCTTSTYTGGNPGAVTELKPSIADYATGNLKQGLTNAADTALKASMVPAAAGGGQPGTLFNLTIGGPVSGYYGFLQASYGAISPATFEGVTVNANRVNTANSRLQFGTGSSQVNGATIIRANWLSAGVVLDHTWLGSYYGVADTTFRAWLISQFGNTVPVTLLVLS